jgi:hypothetical protein
MDRLEKLLYGFCYLDKDESNTIWICITFNDMFGWASSWNLAIRTNFDKPIKAYKDFYNYCLINNINYYKRFNQIPYPNPKTVEGVENYFNENKKVYNDFIDVITPYNEFTREYLQNEKFKLEI